MSIFLVASSYSAIFSYRFFKMFIYFYALEFFSFFLCSTVMTNSPFILCSVITLVVSMGPRMRRGFTGYDAPDELTRLLIFLLFLLCSI